MSDPVLEKSDLVRISMPGKPDRLYIVVDRREYLDGHYEYELLEDPE